MGESNLSLTNPPPDPSSPTKTLQFFELCMFCVSFQNPPAIPTYITYTMFIHISVEDILFWVTCFKKKCFHAHHSTTCFCFFPHDSVFKILLHKYITVLFSQSPVDGQFGGFQLLTVTNSAATCIYAYASWAHRSHRVTPVGTKPLGWKVWWIPLYGLPKVLLPSLKSSWEIEWAPRLG